MAGISRFEIDLYRQNNGAVTSGTPPELFELSAQLSMSTTCIYNIHNLLGGVINV